jgi:FkbM family methyltransferase
MKRFRRLIYKALRYVAEIVGLTVLPTKNFRALEDQNKSLDEDVKTLINENKLWQDRSLFMEEGLEKKSPKADLADKLMILNSFPSAKKNFSLGESLGLVNRSKSQLGQDLFALATNGFGRGYFVEFGATDGQNISNTYILEKEFGWHGILAEPAKKFHRDLEKNRKCAIEHMAVWKETGSIVEFLEAEEFSTFPAFKDSDELGYRRATGNEYLVETISLEDMLKKHNAPKNIDFISIDTEGSELEILKAFNFELYDVRAFAIEHNYRTERQLIFELLTRKGFRRVLDQFSYWDDWYVASNLIPEIL